MVGLNVPRFEFNESSLVSIMTYFQPSKIKTVKVGT